MRKQKITTGPPQVKVSPIAEQGIDTGGENRGENFEKSHGHFPVGSKCLRENNWRMGMDCDK